MGRPAVPGIYRGKDGNWKVDKVFKGHRLRGVFGSDLEEAESFVLTELQRIRHARTRAAAQGVRYTFEEAARHYLELNEQKTSLDNEVAWLKELMPFVGELPLDRIYDATLKPFVDSQRKKPVKRGTHVQIGVRSKTINLKLGLVRHILRQASRSWRDADGRTWLPAPPLLTMVEGGDEREARQLTWQEQREHLHQLPDHLARMALFMLQCGVRDEVACTLRWSWEVKIPELDIVAFIVPPEAVKGRKGKKRSRVLVCNSIARSIVDEQREKHDEFVFVYQHNRFRAGDKGLRRADYTPRAPRPVQTMNNTAWQNWRARCGLGDLHVHDLRHTVGMRLREAGVAEETRADILWHTRANMPRHYAVAQVVEIHAALEKITSERHGFNKSLASIAREQQVPTKVPAKKNAA